MDTTAVLPALLITAAVLGALHTLVGVDHYLPIALLAREARWSLPRLWATTALFGLGHVLASVAIASVGLGLGAAVDSIAKLDGARGSIAAQALLVLGLGYGAWGILRVRRRKQHSHPHVHLDGNVHAHGHSHEVEHAHVHPSGRLHGIALRMLLVILLVGPCEALLPLLTATGIAGEWFASAAVVAVFGSVTIATMVGLATAANLGLAWSRAAVLERFAAAVSGFAMAACGLAILWFEF